jgi:hypothetical protein
LSSAGSRAGGAATSRVLRERDRMRGRLGIGTERVVRPHDFVIVAGTPFQAGTP